MLIRTGDFFSRRNIRDDTNFQCRFDGTPKTADCPIIRLGYILDQFNTNQTALLLEVKMQKNVPNDKSFSYCRVV
jgi:hypothetical protein